MPKQRNKIKHLTLLAALIGLFTACSHIDPDERLIYVKPVDVARAVLIEDFTGQRCVNCPDAAETITSLKAQYGDSTVIAVALHSGPLAVFPTATAVGLRTEEGDAYYDHWQIDREPLGYVNRTGDVATHDQWGTLVRQAVQQPATVRLSLTADYDPSASLLTVHTEALGIDAVATARLQLWLTESHITAIQMMPDGSANRTYEHNHVFRTSVNGMWGEAFPLAEGETRSVTHTLTLDAAWVPQNLSVVAFVYDDNGVQQVVEEKMKE